MKKHGIGFLMAVAILGIGTLGKAAAAETANATLGNFRIQALSLAPGGGSFSLAAGNASYYSFNGISYNNAGIDGPLGAPLEIAYQGNPQLSGTAHIVAGDPLSAANGPSAYTSATASAPGTYMQTYAYLMLGQIVIGPHTELILTANAITSISATSINANDFAAATIQIGDATGANIITWDYSLIYTDFDGQLFDYRKPELRVVLDNDTDTAVTRYAYVASRSSVVMAAVPEPASYAQMLLGFVFLAYWGRKRIRFCA